MFNYQWQVMEYSWISLNMEIISATSWKNVMKKRFFLFVIQICV